MAFKLAVEDFRNKWQGLPKVVGIQNVTRELDGLFGEPAAKAVAESFAPVEAARSQSTLHVSRDTRTLLPVATPGAMKAKNHTFHGN